MLLDIAFLIIGLALILVGANALTDGSSALARKYGVSDLVIGLTVVAFGTSAPELVISVMSAIQGNAGLAVGNVVGSNLFNILAIIGITAIIRPLTINRSMLFNDIPLVVLSSLVLLAMGNGPLLDGTDVAMLTRVDGIILLLLFAIFMRYTFAQAHNGDAAMEMSPQRPMSTVKSIVWVAGGLAGLIYGGDRFVAGASGLASAMGVSDAVIGLTIVAAGTSLPELATSITAAVKNRIGMAVGNVIGSCVFNVFMVLGCAGTIRPLPFGDIGNVDLLSLVGASVLFWLFGSCFGHRTFTRSEGVLMTLCYVAYVVWLVTSSAI